jgi:DNA polymerase-3 subunit epsilon
MKDFVFVDVETTGLDPKNDELIELTYGVNDGPLKTLYFGVTEVPDFIDGLIKFTERNVGSMVRATDYMIDSFKESLRGDTFVAANPSFDKSFLHENGLWTGHYRMLDIETFAMAKLDLNFVPSLHDIRGILIEKGYSLTHPDHSSYNDTMTLREAFNILRYI